MVRLDIEDILVIVLKSLILTAIFVPLLIGLFYLVHINIGFAYTISDKLDIPRDLALTPMSAGFANNIMILSTVFEFGFTIWLITKLSKTHIYKNIKNFVINL